MSAGASAAGMSPRDPTVVLALKSRPQSLTLVRGMLAGVAESLALDPELLDDLKTAVSEAANNVVTHAYEGEPGPLDVLLFLEGESVEVVVRDRGRGIPADASAEDHGNGIGLPLIRALTQQLELGPGPHGGTEVKMRFSGVRAGKRLFELPDQVAAEDGFTERLDGDTVASLSPVGLVGAVLGRLARAMAAEARFSLDRFSDIYLVTDAIAAHAASAAAGGRIAFSLQSAERRLELAVGPFRPGAASGLSESPDTQAFPLAQLTDELAVEPLDEGELLRATLLDSER
jgi:serine/threonine-protein kinase RsbW